MFKTLPGGFAPPPTRPPYQGFALDPLGALSGPQTPRPIILHPPFLIPGYGPGVVDTLLSSLILLAPPPSPVFPTTVISGETTWQVFLSKICLFWTCGHLQQNQYSVHTLAYLINIGYINLPSNYLHYFLTDNVLYCILFFQNEKLSSLPFFKKKKFKKIFQNEYIPEAFLL